MKCLYCGKPLSEHEVGNDVTGGWHAKCVKSFFGTLELPKFDLSTEGLIKLAESSVGSGNTVPGVQKKISWFATSKKKRRLTVTGVPSAYILKPETDDYPHLPEAEHLCMSMAKATGIRTVPFALIRAEVGYVYITKRVDRADGKMFAMEDFCQLDGRMSEDKYKGSYERCAKIIQRYSCREGFDLSELFLRLVFSFVSGNSDMHLKNFSLIEEEEGSQRYALSPAYDLLPVNLILPDDEEQTALALNGKKSNLRLHDFLSFAKAIGLSDSASVKLIRDVVGMRNKYVAMIFESLLPDEMKDDFANLIDGRINILNLG